MSRHMNEPTDGASKPKAWVFVAALAVVAVLVFVGIQVFEGMTSKPTSRGDANMRSELSNLPEIEFEGAKYRMKRNLTTILLMGIDHRDFDDNTQTELTNGSRNGGQSDFLRLLVVDDGNKEVRSIAIDRDTMTPITILGILGGRAGKRTAQITLQHAFGDGKEKSAELTVESVSNLLYNIPINYYFALNMDGISTLNDWLGGVTVPIVDDFSQVDPTLVQGQTITLHGDQAETFVRERSHMNVGTNEARMERQRVYLDAAQELLRERLRSDMNAAENLYDSLSSDFTTNMSKGTLSNIAYATNDYEVKEVVEPEGEHVIGDNGFIEFHVDEQSLLRTIVDCFYDKVE